MERTGTPDLLVVDLSQLLREVLAVCRAAVPLEGLAGLGTVTDALVELLEDGDVGLLEDGCPVESTTAGGGGAGVEHVVHALSTDQGVEGLGGLLDGLVEGFRRGVAVLAEDLVLSQEETLWKV